MQFHNTKSHPFTELEYVGFVLCGSLDQRHIGIAYRTVKGDVKIVDLAWHCLLCNAEPEPGKEWHWGEAGLDEINRQIIAMRINQLADKNMSKYGPDSPVSYGIGYEGEYFDKNTFEYIRNNASEGLTCATFVLAVFKTLALPFIDESSWEVRDDDKEWQEKIVGILMDTQTRYNIPEEHILAQIDKIGAGVRFRPEEVAGSGIVYNNSRELVRFEEGVILGEQILSEMFPQP